VTAQGGGLVRLFSPHTLGRDANRREIVIGYQYGGDRPGGLPAGGEWCCLPLNMLGDVRPNGDAWQRGTGTAPRYQLVSLDVWTT
jgi:hypothetical protein